MVACHETPMSCWTSLVGSHALWGFGISSRVDRCKLSVRACIVIDNTLWVANERWLWFLTCENELSKVGVGLRQVERLRLSFIVPTASFRVKDVLFGRVEIAWVMSRCHFRNWNISWGVSCRRRLSPLVDGVSVNFYYGGSLWLSETQILRWRRNACLSFHFFVRNSERLCLFTRFLANVWKISDKAREVLSGLILAHSCHLVVK